MYISLGIVPLVAALLVIDRYLLTYFMYVENMETSGLVLTKKNKRPLGLCCIYPFFSSDSVCTVVHVEMHITNPLVASIGQRKTDNRF